MKLKNLASIILATGLGIGGLTGLSGCVTEKSMYERAVKSDTSDYYASYLKRFPDSEHRDKFEARRNEIDMQKTRLVSTIDRLLGSAKERIVMIAGETGYRLCISAHLLKNYSPNDSSPLVRGAYGSHDRLRNYVKARIAEIYRSAFTSAGTLNLDSVGVSCMHGVRHIVIGGYGGGDYATTLYSTSIAKEIAKRYDWEKISNEEIQRLWRVNTDIISNIHFQPGS